MKKNLNLALLGMFIALFSLIHTAPTAFASTRGVMTPHRATQAIIRRHGGHCYPHCSSEYNQYFHGDSYSHQHLTFRGSNGNNTGNQGTNSGHTVDYAANGGNLTVNHSKSRYSHINQHFSGNSYSWTPGYFEGHNFNNSGNQGLNRGSNINYGSNGGNLIVNQGRSGRYLRVNQYFAGNSYSHDKGTFVGYNENNTGNQGCNRGYNEDHGANGGNQVVN